MEKVIRLDGKLHVIEGVENLKDKLTYEEFIEKAIKNLRDLTQSKGIHTVFSGFNDAFRAYYGEDPVEITQRLVREGKFDSKFVKRGVMLYLPGEGPKNRTKDVLDDILGK